MRTVGIYEAKTHLSELVEHAANGETILITRHGMPIAEIRAASSIRRSQDEVAAAIDAWMAYRELHNIRLGDDLTIRDLIEEGRRY
jgi:prevent-host-death family protein